ncbi:lysylphosphatidylglycerol synthase transmembrane domain-containing protein [Corynebacterium riegelii]|uniref:lysylphosphatidylglycerol synthase transmembrane domain-containing protein n=1 Tax=Corynebacterium riegelii TaxID=156976 RepID=UPI0023F8F694|nr:YbhN family protein [Corynebacterium riegelii]
MNVKTWLRWLAPLAVLVLVLVIFRDRMPFLGQAWELARHAETGLLFGAALSANLAMFAMSAVMQILVNVDRRVANPVNTNAIVYASNAWSTSVPGGPAISAWLTYRVHRSWSASTGVCGWFFVVSGALSTVWMALIGVAAVVFLGAELSPATLGLSLGGAVAIMAAVFWGIMHPAALKRWTPTRVHSLIDQVAAIRISPGSFALAALFSLLNRLFDVLTLLLCAAAVTDSRLSVSAICLAFIMTKLAGAAQITPGGVGTVEPVAVAMLVAGGFSLSDATATTLIYRLISFALITAFGWVVYATTYARMGLGLRS